VIGSTPAENRLTVKRVPYSTRHGAQNVSNSFLEIPPYCRSGKVTLTLEGDALVIEFLATGAKFKLVPWDGDIFIATLMATGQFGPMVDLDYMTKGFAQFQMDKDGKLNLLRLSMPDGQAYEFRRE
jgi:hypothetical protein